MITIKFPLSIVDLIPVGGESVKGIDFDSGLFAGGESLIRKNEVLQLGLRALRILKSQTLVRFSVKDADGGLRWLPVFVRETL